jgi:hypothetical protein
MSTVPKPKPNSYHLQKRHRANHPQSGILPAKAKAAPGLSKKPDKIAAARNLSLLVRHLSRILKEQLSAKKILAFNVHCP